MRNFKQVVQFFSIAGIFLGIFLIAGAQDLKIAQDLKSPRYQIINPSIDLIKEAQTIGLSGDDEIEAFRLAKQLKKKMPLKRRWTKDAKVFITPQGQFNGIFYTRPAHIKNQNGLWIEPDQNIALSSRPDFEFGSDKNLFHSFFKKTFEPNKTLLATKRDNDEFSFSISDKGGRFKKTDAIVSGNQVIYPEILPAVDLVYTIFENRILEEFVLKSKEALVHLPKEFTQKITLPHNIRAKLTKDGQVNLTDKNGKIISFFPAPLLYEKNNQNNFNIGVNFSASQSNKILTLTKTLTDSGLNWLNNNNNFPLVVDATQAFTSETADGYIEDLSDFACGGGSLESHTTAATFQVGTRIRILGETTFFYIWRGFLFFNTGPTIGGTSATVSSATLTLRVNTRVTTGGAPGTVNIYGATGDVQCAGTTLDTGDWNLCTSLNSATLPDNSAGSDASAAIDTGLINRAATNGYTDFRLRLTTETCPGLNQQKSIAYNSADNASNKPSLSVTWNNPPSAPTSLAQYLSNCSSALAGTCPGTSCWAKTAVCFSGSIADVNSGDTVRLQVEYTTGSFTNSPTVTASPGCTPPTCTSTVNSGSLTDGSSYKWQARSIDNSNATSSWASFNSGSTSFRYDGTNPSTSYSSPLAGSWQKANFNINVSDSDATSGLSSCAYDVIDNGTTRVSGASRTCNSTQSITVGASSNCQAQNSSSCDSSTGYCSVNVRATDTAANTNSSVNRKFCIDYTNPSSSYNAPAAGSWQKANFTVNASDSDSHSGLSSCAYDVDDTGRAGTEISGSSRTCNSSSSFTVTVGGSSTCQTQDPSSCSSSTGSCSLNIRATDTAANTNSSISRRLCVDYTAPSGGSISYTDGNYTSAPQITFSYGSDSHSGIDTTNRRIEKRSATLTGEACGSYGSWSALVSNPTSPYTDSSASAGNCYQYRLVVPDIATNSTTYCTDGTACSSINTVKFLSNTAPSFSASPSDNGSSGTAPTNVGSNVSFTATATDSQSDNYYLAICKTNSVTANNSAAPTCPGENWCISGSTASGSQASCNYAALVGDLESNDWYAFVCDHNAASLCSSSSQGSGDNGSPFKVNHRPSFTAIDDSPDPVTPSVGGTNVTITTTASDSDTDTAPDTVKLFVCPTNSLTSCSAGCASTALCAASLTASNPQCNYSVTYTSDNPGTKNYWGFVCDNHNFSAASSQAGSFTINPGLSFSLSATSVVLGTLSTGTVTAGSITATTSTNASSGYVTTIYTDGNFRTAGGSNFTYVTDNNSITAASGKYGIATSQASQTVVQYSGSCVSGSSVGPLSGSTTILNATSSSAAVSVASASNKVSSDTTTLCFAASPSVTTPAGNYSHIITIITTAKF